MMFERRRVFGVGGRARGAVCRCGVGRLCGWRFAVRAMVVGCVVWACVGPWASPVWAEDAPKATKKQLKQMGKLLKDTAALGSWESQVPFIEQAMNNVFSQYGWDSAEDRYARELVRNVGAIPPWKPHERSRAFLDSAQERYGFTHDQRLALQANMQREGMAVTRKHLVKMLPVVMEMVGTRAKQEPFTAEQVRRWSNAFEPMMADALESVERVTSQLKEKMTPEQRAKLDADMKALVRRHRDVEKMVKKWQAGNWNPTDWGLQDDPIHAVAMLEYRASEAEKNLRVREARASKELDESKFATNESLWDLYVRHFCTKYACTDGQRTSASAILKGCKQRALAHRHARRERISKCERLSKAGEDEAVRKHYAAELERELVPISQIFEELKTRLYARVLTTAQQKRFGGDPSVKDAGERQAKASGG